MVNRKFRIEGKVITKLVSKYIPPRGKASKIEANPGFPAHRTRRAVEHEVSGAKRELPANAARGHSNNATLHSGEAARTRALGDTALPCAWDAIGAALR